MIHSCSGVYTHLKVFRGYIKEIRYFIINTYINSRLFHTAQILLKSCFTFKLRKIMSVPGFFSVPMTDRCTSLTGVHSAYILASGHHCQLPTVSVLHLDSNRCYIDCCPRQQTVRRRPFSTRVCFCACVTNEKANEVNNTILEYEFINRFKIRKKTDENYPILIAKYVFSNSYFYFEIMNHSVFISKNLLKKFV